MTAPWSAGAGAAPRPAGACKKRLGAGVLRAAAGGTGAPPPSCRGRPARPGAQESEAASSRLSRRAWVYCLHAPCRDGRTCRKPGLAGRPGLPQAAASRPECHPPPLASSPAGSAALPGAAPSPGGRRLAGPWWRPRLQCCPHRPEPRQPRRLPVWGAVPRPRQDPAAQGGRTGGQTAGVVPPHPAPPAAFPGAPWVPPPSCEGP